MISTTAPSGVVEKQPGRVDYEPLVLEVDTSLAAGFYDRITGFLDGSQKTMSGAVRFLDYGLTEQSRLEWTSGLISEVAFPAADTRREEGGRTPAGHDPTGVDPTPRDRRQGRRRRRFESPEALATPPTSNSRSAAWRTRPGKSAKVESLTIRRSVTAGPGGLVAGALEVPDVIFTVATSEGTPFYDWFEDFVINGKNSAGDEQTAPWYSSSRLSRTS